MRFLLGLLVLLAARPATAAKYLLSIENPDCAVMLTRGSSVGELQQLLGLLGLNDQHRIVLDGARGLPVQRQLVTAGRNQPSPITIERLIAHPQAQALPFLRIEPVSTGEVDFDLMMKTRRSNSTDDEYYGRSTVNEQIIARQAYLKEQREALLSGDITEFLQDTTPRFRLNLTVQLPLKALSFAKRPDRYLRFSPATRVEILRRMGVFEAMAKLNLHANYFGATMVEDVNGIELHSKDLAYTFYPRVVIPRQMDNSEFVGNILFYSALHRHLVTHYPESLGLPMSTEARPEMPYLTATPSPSRRTLGGLKRGAAPVIRTAAQIEAEFNASIVRSEPTPDARFHVETSLGPFSIEGYVRP